MHKRVGDAFIILLLCLSALPSYTQNIFNEDFERYQDQELASPWLQIYDNQHPAYNKACFIQDSHLSYQGKGALKLYAQGKNVAVETGKNLIPINPAFSYLLQLYTKVKFVENNYVQVSAILLDKNLTQIKEYHSGRIRTTSWQIVQLVIDTIPENSKYAQIRLALEGSDVQAEAYFDDILLRPIPDLEINFASAWNLYTPQEKITCDLKIKDSPEGDYFIEVSVKDKVVNVLKLKKGDLHTLNFEPLEAGYHNVIFRLKEKNKVIFTWQFPLIVYLPLKYPQQIERDFGIIINPYQARYKDLVSLIKFLNIARTKLVVYDYDYSNKKILYEPDKIKQIISQIKPVVEIIGVFNAFLPPEDISLENLLHEIDPVDFFMLEQGSCLESITTGMKKHSPDIKLWQYGSDSKKFVEKAGRFGNLIEKAVRVFKQSGAKFGVATAGALPEDTFKECDFISYNIFQRDDIKNISHTEQQQLHLVVHADTNPSEFAKKIIMAKAAGGQSSYIYFVLTPQERILDENYNAGEFLLSIRTLNDVLSGAEYIKDVKIFEPPVESYVFKKRDTIVVALWTEHQEITVDFFLGRETEILTLDGKFVKAPASVKITRQPIFIINIDKRLFDTVSSLKFDDTTILMRTEITKRVISFKNHFADKLTNIVIQIKPMDSQITLTPSDTFFIPVVSPAESINKEIGFSVPLTETETEKSFLMAISFVVQPEKHIYNLRLMRKMITKSAIECDIAFDPVSGTDSKKVTIRITNKDTAPLSLTARLRLPAKRDTTINIGILGSLQSYTIEEILDDYKEVKGQKMYLFIREDSPRGNFTNIEKILE